MKLSEIMKIVEADIPPEYAEDWDNVGLLVGDPDKEVRKILLSLDASDAAIEKAAEIGADLLMTHHPMIFTAMKQVRADHFIGRRIIRLICNDISYYAMHTNYDIARMADVAADKLGLEHQIPLAVTGEADGQKIGFGKVGDLKVPVTLREFAQTVREVYGLPGIPVYGNEDLKISRVAMCPGSGKSFMDEAIASGADVYLTGDVDYHTGIDANARGIAVIDAGHYGVEHVYMEDMKQYLTCKLPDEITMETMPVTHPYFSV